MNSFFAKLDVSDFVKGLIVAVLASAGAIIIDTINQGSLTFDWSLIGKTALAAGLAYIMKNLFTNSQGEPFTKEPK